MTNTSSRFSPVKLIETIWGFREYGVSIGIRGFATIAGFAVTFLIGRTWGPEANGQYAIINQTAMFVGSVALIGMDWGIVRHGAESAARNLRVATKSFLQLMFCALALLTLSIGVLTGFEFANLKPLPVLNIDALLFMPLLILIATRGIARIIGAFLRSQSSFGIDQLIAVALFPILIATMLASGYVLNVNQLIWGAAWMSLIPVAIGLLVASRYISSSEEALFLDMRSVLKTSLPMWGVALSLTFLDWYLLVATAYVLDAYQAGLLRVALQIVLVMQTTTTALFMVFSTKISVCLHQQNFAAAARMTRNATLLSLACSLPVFLAVVLAPELLLGIFGDEFRAVADVLVVLACGQLLVAAFGPCGVTLAMAGRGKITLLINTVSIVIFAIVAPLALFMAGLMGVSIAFVLLGVARSLLSFGYIRARMSINVVTGKYYGPDFKPTT